MITRPIIRASRLCTRCYATSTSSTPPMLLKIRKDLKTAMQSKDTTRLGVLRALLSQSLNASKTANPINTDMQMLALIRKSTNASKAASEEFKSAGRQDLADKEDLQVSIMEEYAGGVEVMSEEEMRSVVRQVVESLRSEGGDLKIGYVLGMVFGRFGGQPVDKGIVAKIVKDMLAEKA